PWSAVTQLAEDLAARAGKMEGITGAAVGYAATGGPAGPVAERDTPFRLPGPAPSEATRAGAPRPLARTPPPPRHARGGAGGAAGEGGEAAADGTDRRRIRRAH